MSSHTPGPWSVGSPTGLMNQLSIEPAIGVVYGAGEEIRANARLIAAAPELLECLRYALDVSASGLPLGGEWQARARAAITKAKGEES